MFHRIFECALAFGAYSGDAVGQQFSAIVQEAFEDTNVAVIDIGNIPKLQRIGLILDRFALVLVSAIAIRVVIVIIALTRIAAATCS